MCQTPQKTAEMTSSHYLGVELWINNLFCFVKQNPVLLQPQLESRESSILMEWSVGGPQMDLALLLSQIGSLFSSCRFEWHTRLRQIQIFWISEPDTEPNKVGSLGSDQYKDTIPLWENGKFCISEPDTDPNWVGSFGSARYTWRYVTTLQTHISQGKGVSIPPLFFKRLRKVIPLLTKVAPSGRLMIGVSSSLCL